MDKIFVMCLCNRFTHQNRELLQINEKAEVSNDNKRFTKGNIEISINMRTVVRHRYSSHEWRRKRQDAAESHRASELRWGRPATPRTWTLGEPRREHGACRNRPRACPSCRFALPPASPQSSPPPRPREPPRPLLRICTFGLLEIPHVRGTTPSFSLGCTSLGLTPSSFTYVWPKIPC